MNPLVLMTILFFVLSNLSAQQLNKEIKLENSPPYMVGQIDVKGLSSNSYEAWYSNTYNEYKVDANSITSIKNDLAKHKILLFMGTWCGDSKREVPRFIKILEAADFPMENLKLVAVDRRKEHYKKSPSGEEWGLRIERVPTFIFLKNGKETNRIIESPITSLEKDIEAIVLKRSYTPNYAKSLHFD